MQFYLIITPMSIYKIIFINRTTLKKNHSTTNPYIFISMFRIPFPFYLFSPCIFAPPLDEIPETVPNKSVPVLELVVCAAGTLLQ